MLYDERPDLPPAARADVAAKIDRRRGGRIARPGWSPSRSAGGIEAEAGLAAALERLPDAAVPNNFTARVLQAVEREAAAARRRTGGGLWRRLGWLPRAAVATGVLGVGLIACHQMQSVERKKLAESVIAVADIPSLPSPDILQDFDAIRASYPAAAPDEQLLALLK